MSAGIDVGYEYVNARLRAMRSRLLQRTEFEQLLAAPNLEALIGQVDQSQYHDALEQSLVTSAGLDAILRAVQIDHGAILRRIAAFGGETIAPALGILLAPYHRHNIVVLLRGVSARAGPERILPWLFALPPFSEGMLAELARQATARSLVDLLAQWRLPTDELAGSLVAALPAGPNLRQLVTAFDLAWAESTTRQAAALPGSDGNLVRLDLVRSLDLHNLLLALDLHEVELARPAPWLAGGWLSPEALERLRTAADIQAMDMVLDAAREGEFWRQSLAQWDDRRLTTLQHGWESTLFHWRVSLFSEADPLGVGVLIAFLAAKGAEVRNLRLIAEAVAGNIGRDEARAYLLLGD
ncbi:MAG: V-type ATPase subunit [Chloroflexota bacterium]|nr:V-type ATPase subunit [Chloroflexota bacterium]